MAPDLPCKMLAAAAAAALAGACAAPGPFPSLKPREIERTLSIEPPVRAPVFVAPDPALQARTAQLLALARAGERDFDAAYPAASEAAARAGAEGSESWVIAQQALSRVEAARAETIRALAELDQLAIARAPMPTNEGDHEALNAALAAAADVAAAQQLRIDRLRAAIRR